MTVGLASPGDETTPLRQHGSQNVRIRQAKGQVEHVVLVVSWLLKRVVDVILEDDVTR